MGLFGSNDDEPETEGGVPAERIEAVADQEISFDPGVVSYFAVRRYGPAAHGEKVEAWAEMPEPISKQEFAEYAESEQLPEAKYKLLALDDRKRTRGCIWTVEAGVEGAGEPDPEEQRLDQIQRELREIREEGRTGDVTDEILLAAMRGELDVDTGQIEQAGELVELKATVEQVKSGGTPEGSSLAEMVSDPTDAKEVGARGLLSMLDGYDTVGDAVEDVLGGAFRSAQTAVGPAAGTQQQQQAAQQPQQQQADPQAGQPQQPAPATDERPSPLRESMEADDDAAEPAQEPPQQPTDAGDQDDGADVEADDAPEPAIEPAEESDDADAAGPDEPPAMPANATELDEMDYEDVAALAGDLGHENPYQTEREKLREYVVAALFSEDDGTPDGLSAAPGESEITADAPRDDAATDGGKADE